jgi:RND superfamily putative drug exporter
MSRNVTGFAIRRPVLVIVLWIAIVGTGFGVGIGVFQRLVSDVGTVPGSESARATTRLAAAAPEPGKITAVVSGRPASDPAVRSSVDQAMADVRGMPGVAGVSGPLPASDGGALLIEVALRPQGATGTGVSVKATAKAAAARLERVQAAGSGTRVAVSGGPLTDSDFNTQAQSDVQRAELVSMPVVLVLLLLIFGGLLAAGLPLLISVVGIGTAFGILYLFSQVSDVSVYSIQVVTMLSVGLAVDYALLIVSRFREERATNCQALAGPIPTGFIGADINAAVRRTIGTAGRTVFFSGLTVAASLAGLMVFPDPFLRSMGLAGAAVVVVDMLAALTLLPALLTLLGHRISPALSRQERLARRDGGVFARIARGVQRRPGLILLATSGALIVLALPALDLRLSTGDPRLLPTSTHTRQLYDAMQTHFPERNGPNAIVVLAGDGADSPELAQFRTRLAAVPGVTGVSAQPASASLTILRATPANEPASAAAGRTVQAIRALPAPFEVSVTGDAARLVDYRTMLTHRIPWAAAVVALATMVLLFAFTGSILLPVKAVLTNLLSIGAALGVVVWVFQQGHLVGLFGSIKLDDTHLTVPVLVAAIAFGLSVDYEVFLLSRIRERWLAGDGASRAVSEGLQQTGRIITSAALLLVVVFGGFLVGGFAPIKQIGLGLALAVALDATVVRMLLVPATMTLLGRYNWWAPGPLRRLHKRIGLSESPTAIPAGALDGSGAPAGPRPDPVSTNAGRPAAAPSRDHA